MRIARWTHGVRDCEGFVIDDRALEFPDSITVDALLRGGLKSAQELYSTLVGNKGARYRVHGVALADVVLRAPLEPRSVRDFVAFEEHVEGMTVGVDGGGSVDPAWYEFPTFYFTNPHTIAGPCDTIRPPVTDRLDFELELAAVLGGDTAVNLSADAGEAAIFGYTIMNDWSARDLQFREMKVRLGPAKGKDFATTLGPWIVTADEFIAHRDAMGYLALRAEVWVNDRLAGEDSLANMGWPFGDLVAYASRNSKVVAGDVFGSGTVGNGGCLAELWGRRGYLDPPALVEGDVVRMRIENLGEIANVVGAPVAGPDIRSARQRSPAERRAALDARRGGIAD